MPLTLLDFVQQVENVTVDDIPDSTQDSINDELNQQTGGGGGTDISNPSDARIVADTVADLNDRAGFTSIQDAIDGTNGNNEAATDTVAEDGTIFVEPGTYPESITLGTSGVTIQSTQGSGETTINGQSSTAVEIRASDVTIDGFEIRNTGTEISVEPTDFSGVIGVSVQSKNTGVTVRNCELRDLGTENNDANPIGVYAQGATSGITVEDNRIETLEGTDEDEGAVQAVLINSQRAQNGISTGIDNARVANNTITDLLDTRSTNAVRFNGDVSGEIVGNTISDLKTEGDIPGTNAPGGFTQVISLTQGGNSTTGPSDVTIKNNDISSIETTTPGNFAPPVHLILGSSTDGSSVTVTGNSFSADSPDVEIFVQDGSGGLNLGSVESGNTFSPSAQVNGSDIFPGDLTLVSGGGDALQTAIDDASSGDRLAIDDSTYNPVTVTKPLDLQSIFGRPTIDASGSNPGIAIEAVDTLVSGFEVTGDDNTVSGISIRTSKGATQDIRLRNNVVSGITGAGGGGDVQVSFGILSFGDSQLQNLRVVNNVIDTVGRTSASNVAGQNEVPGFGMQLEEISGAFVFDNIVRDTRGTEGQVENYGIGIQPLDDNSVSADFPASATVQQNTIENAAVGIVRGDTTDPDLTQIANNTFNSVDTEIRQIPQNTTTN